MQSGVLNDEALRLLACPICHAPLTLLSEKDQITCTGCGRRYPVRDGLPILLPTAAQL